MTKLDPARFSGLYVLGALVVLFAFWVPETFLTRATAVSLAGDQAITLILALGILVAFAAGQFDLSAAQNLGLSAVICASLIADAGLPWPVAAGLTLCFGALVGSVNGALVRVGVDSFIVTLGMSSVLLATTALVSDNKYIGPLDARFRDIATTQPLGIPIVTIYAAVLVVVEWYVLEHTPLGRRLYATGANADAARLSGVRTNQYSFGCLVASGTIASLAGVLVAARIGQVSPTLGPPYLLPAFAACFLGATQWKVGRFNVIGTVIAIFLLAVGVKGLQLAGADLWVTSMFDGVALIGAVTIGVVGGKRRDAVRRAATART